ncbi:trichothecene 3-o-acetyltransferase [Apiospora marii]|uniref:Trichothecene 3-o-acetyltransferase n=1 Tax=Apiospora marii TaxID=335849 RepID=A0ABR1SU20_9PEZI
MGNDQKDFVALAMFQLPTPSSDQELTPLDLVMPRVYGTRWILCFPLSSEADTKQVLVSPFTPTHTDKANSSKDLAKDMPSYADLKAQGFPLDKFSTAQLSPLGVMPEPPSPVMAAQANFIEGGLLLTVAFHHSAGDATALETILGIWAQNTAAVASDSKAFASPDARSTDRSALMQGTPPASMDGFPEYLLKPDEKQPTVPADENAPPPAAFQMPPMQCRILYFSAAKLAELKQEAAAYSTNDAMSAFLWCQMTAARNPSSDVDGKVSAFAYAVNIRSRTSPPLPPTYLGNGSMPSMTDRLPVSELLGSVDATTASGGGLKRAAAAIRTSLQRYDTPSRVSETLGLLGARADPADYKLTFNAFLGPDIVSTSWADIKVYAQNWGRDLGSPEGFRMPGEGADGIVMIMPRRPGDDGLEVLVGLELGAMGRFLESAEFRRFAEVRC